MGSTEEERGKWGNKVQFLLSALGFAVGLGNVWRYLYVAYKNGGGAFLIPYWTCVFSFAIPLIFLELVIGQYSSLSPNVAFERMCPPLRGIGYTMILMSIAQNVYYNVILAKAYYYLFVSLMHADNLPYDKCEEDWNTILCYSSVKLRRCYIENGAYALGHCFRNDSLHDYLINRKNKGHADFNIINPTWCQMLCKISNALQPKQRKNETEEQFKASDQRQRRKLLQSQFWENFGKEHCGEKTQNNESTCITENQVVDYNPSKTTINDTQRWLIANTNTLVLAAQEYHENFVTGISIAQDATDIGPSTLKPHLIGCLAVAWIVCFLCLIQGVQSSGKVVYFTATYPYFGLTLFLIAGLTLDGAGSGIFYYITPTFKKVAEPQVWVQAAGQIFLSTSACIGGMISLSSYNRFKNNIVSDTVFIALGNCFTSVLAGFTVFSILGFLANQQSLEIGEVTRSSSGLAFVSMPTAITLMPSPTLFAFVFFTMIITLGLDSQLTLIETSISALQDVYPILRSSKLYKAGVVGVYCFIMFFLGFICCTNAGEAWVDILDTYMVGYVLIVVGLVESTGITFLYGEKRLSDHADRWSILRYFTFIKEGLLRIICDAETMVGDNKCYIGVRKCWARYIAISFYTISPQLLLVIGVSTYSTWKNPTNEPASIVAVSWLLYVAVIMPIPVFFIYEICQRRKGQRFTPSPLWGSAKQKQSFSEEDANSTSPSDSDTLPDESQAESASSDTTELITNSTSFTEDTNK